MLATDRLAQIAQLLLGLTYQEMLDLADMLGRHIDTKDSTPDTNEIAHWLIDWADDTIDVHSNRGFEK